MVVQARVIPRFEPVKASAFSTLAIDVRGLLIDNGAVPVNDVFFDLWDDLSKILLLYGGYGSGKSVFIVDKLLKHCLKDEYFRCFYGRKVHDTVRNSVFQTLVDRIKELKLQHLFLFSEADNSSMVIRCRHNGNSFRPFGADNPDKLKSVKDPSHVFADEMDQFSEKDFGVLMSRLRTSKTKTQFIGAFNTEKVLDNHWIKLAFFAEESTELSKLYSEYSLRKIFCNYPDNYFINRGEYEQTLWLSAAFNETVFRQMADGEWGSSQKDNTFIYRFRKKQRSDIRPGYAHVFSGLEVDYSLPVILSFDFNVEPITCLVIQHAHDLSWVSILQEYRLLNSDIFELCTRIATDHPEAFFIVTGDASGKNRTAITRGNRNYYQIIREELKLNARQFVLPGANPSIANTRVLCNLLLARHPAYLINSSCKWLIADIENVIVDENGDIDKKKDAHKTHLLDCWRYYNWNFLYSFYKQLLTSKQT